MAAFLRSLGLTLSLAAVALSASSSPRTAQASAELTVHEWGTFTSVADRRGTGAIWHPQSNPDDLPSFVEFSMAGGGKSNLRGTVRMETPVLYFYAPSDLMVSVNVGFPQGVISEWYPHASSVRPDPKQFISESALLLKNTYGRIQWDSVAIEPNLAPNFSHDESNARYYTARETSSAPIVVRKGAGTQQEKFLFYRGVGAFSPPVAAQVMPGGKITVRNLSDDEVPAIILFERRGDKLGYRMLSDLQRRARTEYSLDPPELTATVESLSGDLEELLVAQGLYREEAHAMVETWRQSWFEEGSRLFYIVPPSFVNSVLPLTIKPAPSQTVRAFVGRLELITPATERAVETALSRHDRTAILGTYARFLEPIMDQLKAENPGQARKLDQELNDTYSASPAPIPSKGK